MHTVGILIGLLWVGVVCAPKKKSLACFNPDPETGECLDADLAKARQKKKQDEKRDKEDDLHDLKDRFALKQTEMSEVKILYDAATDDGEKQRLGERYNALVLEAKEIVRQIRHTHSWTEAPSVSLQEIDLPYSSPPQIYFIMDDNYKPVIMPVSVEGIPGFDMRYVRKDIKSPGTDLSGLEIPLWVTFNFENKKYCVSLSFHLSDLNTKNFVTPEECHD